MLHGHIILSQANKATVLKFLKTYPHKINLDYHKCELYVIIQDCKICVFGMHVSILDGYQVHIFSHFWPLSDKFQNNSKVKNQKWALMNGPVVLKEQWILLLLSVFDPAEGDKGHHEGR